MMDRARGRRARILTIAGFAAIVLSSPAIARWHASTSADARAGQFDYFLLSLSWSPEHCAGDGLKADELQCSSARPYGFVVHGLWPQSEDGPRDSCAAGGRLNRSIVDGMLDIMPSASLIRHEWKTHGACSGMPPADYFAKVRAARSRVHIPEAYRDPRRVRYVDAKEVRRDFLQANAGFDGADFAVICRQRHLREIRVCLEKDLRPRACGPDVHDQWRGEVAVRPLR
jgi:ribonuclease T2